MYSVMSDLEPLKCQSNGTGLGFIHKVLTKEQTTIAFLISASFAHIASRLALISSTRFLVGASFPKVAMTSESDFARPRLLSKVFSHDLYVFASSAALSLLASRIHGQSENPPFAAPLTTSVNLL